MLSAPQLIKTKRENQPLSLSEIQFFIEGYTSGKIPDYQMSSLLMAIFLNGMSPQETADLTRVMLESGTQLNFSGPSMAVDKHSTGGVGDKTSLILAPLVAACGIPVPMMSGRGLGHTGGTLDKLESIPGFNVFLSLDEFKKMVEEHKLSFIGQTQDICPADKKIYALRDVTATVESLPLISASIMSKKIAEGIKALVLDVKTGSGAFMKTMDESRKLADSLISIGKSHGLQVKALITNMNQVLGQFVGNALEVQECLAILKQENWGPCRLEDVKDTQDLSVELAAEMVSLSCGDSLDESRNRVMKALTSGAAFEKFSQVCAHQGGNLEKLPKATQSFDLESSESGYLQSMNCESVGLAAIELGAGRKQVSDQINPIPGIQVLKKLGDKVEKSEPLFRIWGDDSKSGFETAQEILKNSFRIGHDKPTETPLIFETRS